MLNKLDAELSFHQTSLRVRGQRQELIAANIANADTPNFKARDLDFAAAMQQAMSQNDPAQAKTNQITKTSDKHFDALPTTHLQMTSGAGEPLYRPIIQGSVDGNTVDMDVERNQFVDNGIRYEASLTMINGQLKKMLAAIQGQ
ncbi:MAG TPA: flagellar basal body rod protein FlgB [Methylotenera sp.]|nr:flagellar basal body rod protein FlgB [Methylotenera sp.]HPH04953.1 flagellar basal body rod protein FlgB [Methylotenera sp.]HPN02211.1 flagellar basal body rod protein FlgB [Methylotenera sp.]